MDQAPAKLYTIPNGVGFAEALAGGLLDQAEGDSLALSRMLVLLPTRRACRALREAFLRQSQGRPLLLPRMWPIGDLDEEELLFGATGLGGVADLPPPMAQMRRQLLLGKLVLKWRATGAAPVEGQDQALRLAAELGRLIDQVETEDIDFDGLEGLVHDNLSHHWAITLDFLRIVTENWPGVQEDQGAIGPAEHRRRLIEMQAEAWTANPPDHPVIAAGSTGSIPATAALLGVVARLPRGAVVLPGLDQESGESHWDSIAEDPSHPQYGLAQLLGRLGAERRDVAPWPHERASSAPEPRRRLIAAALRPAKETADWPHLGARFGSKELDRALAGITRLDCASPHEEALAVALALREALETPGKTAALITPDRQLARRVAAELQRWGLAIDDSAGRPLKETPVGAFLRLTARLMIEGPSPLHLLSALKHPLASGGLEAGRFRDKLRRFERALLRGPRPEATFANLGRLLDAALAEASARGDNAHLADLPSWFKDLQNRIEPYSLQSGERLRAGPGERSLKALLEDHVRMAEALAEDDERPGAERLWADEDGEAASLWLRELIESAGDLEDIDPGEYPAVLDSLMESAPPVRPAYGSHPRLNIWGPLEARLQQADRVILGSLNEGTWPRDIDPGPWLSRPMRRDFGLPPLERQIGLSAHDFQQALGAEEVILTRAVRVEGAPSVPSRWMLRLEALLKALGRDEAALAPAPENDWLALARALDRPDSVQPLGEPQPRPPVAARPKRVSVTDVELWMRDPYAFYAKRILKLAPLEPIDADVTAAERGTLIHEILERFVEAHPDALPADPLAKLLEIGGQVFKERETQPALAAYWWPRFTRAAEWVIEQEGQRRPHLAKLLAERRAVYELPGFDGHSLIAKADRIERYRGGGTAIVDYKTGQPPSKIDVRLGFSPQLSLEAAMAEAGAFGDDAADTVAEQAYWHLSGGREPARAVVLSREDADPDAALKGLIRLFEVFSDADQAYLSKPRAKRAPKFNDYDHLARSAEWAEGGGEG